MSYILFAFFVVNVTFIVLYIAWHLFVSKNTFTSKMLHLSLSFLLMVFLVATCLPEEESYPIYSLDQNGPAYQIVLKSGPKTSDFDTLIKKEDSVIHYSLRKSKFRVLYTQELFPYLKVTYLTAPVWYNSLFDTHEHLFVINEELYVPNQYLVVFKDHES